jgi:hypothetical protein
LLDHKFGGEELQHNRLIGLLLEQIFTSELGSFLLLEILKLYHHILPVDSITVIRNSHIPSGNAVAALILSHGFLEPCIWCDMDMEYHQPLENTLPKWK